MRFKARSQLAAILALLGALVGTSPALANDYSVDFGVETKAGKDAGSLTCQLDQTCSGELESLGLRVSILLYGSPYDRGDRASIHLNDRDFSCCYFEYAADRIMIDPRQSLHRVPFFKGARARGGLYIENERVGTLYLKFHFR